MSKVYSPKVFAHRGSNTLAPENSKPAFDLALIEGADGFETDIQFSRDYTPLLWHDDDMERIGMPGKSTEDYIWSELELLDISLLCSEFHRYCAMLNLEDFLREYSTTTPLLLELKSVENKKELNCEEKIKSFLNQLATCKIEANQAMISSFELPLIKITEQLTDKNFLILNIDKEELANDLEGLFKREPYLKGVCLEKDLISKENSQLARKNNIQTLIYTCNTEEEIKKALDCEVDIIISDKPGNSKKIIKKLLKAHE